MSEDLESEAKHHRRTPYAERILRQFLKLESGVDPVKYASNYDTAMKDPEPFKGVVRCATCEYEARTEAEMRWHERCGHFAWTK